MGHQNFEYQRVLEFLGLHVELHTPLDVLKIVRQGIPGKSIDCLASNIHTSTSELTKCLHISERTLQRYRKAPLLSPAISDQLFQIAKVYIRSINVFEDIDDALNWLNQVSFSLGNIAPLELLDTSIGIEMVLDEFTRIEYGVLS